MVTKRLQIGEAAKETGVPPKTLRYYEDIGLLQPDHTDSSYRQFDADALERIRFTLKAKILVFTLDEITDVLRLKDEETESCGIMSHHQGHS
jgi:DNA-binding transcriptional MerR regulator